MLVVCILSCAVFLFFQAEDGIRDLVRSRGLGDVYKRQLKTNTEEAIAQGVFGVPAMVVDGRIFWGLDALPLSLIHI